MCSGEDTPETVIKLSTLNERIDRIVSLLKVLQENNEVIFVEDLGTLITPQREMVDWLKQSLRKLKSKFVIGISSKYYLNKTACIESVFSIKINELDRSDRANMLREYCEQNEIDLKRDSLREISELLTGYPAQIFWVVALLQDYGEVEIPNHYFEIVDYSHDKAAAILNHFEGNEKAYDFLAYLSMFEIISANILHDAFDIDEELQELYCQFCALSICNSYGSSGEMIRISDVIRTMSGDL